MTLLQLQEKLRERVRVAARERFGVELDQINSEAPPSLELGDLAFPVAFELAKRIKQAKGERLQPRNIAEQLGEDLLTVREVTHVEVAGAGYLNVFYDRPLLLAHLASAIDQPTTDPLKQPVTTAKQIVEHTNINPNKAAHIGHLRNAVLGDTFVRILRAAGEQVEVQNYIDNTGVQVADVVVGFLHLEHLNVEQVRALYESLSSDYPFDYYCWDLYSRVGSFYRGDDPNAKEDPERLKLRSDVLHAIELGSGPTAELADYVATRIVEAHLKTMGRLDIRYDLLPRESDILHLHFWERAFERLKTTGVIHFQAEGRNAGCWVMPTDLHTGSKEHEADKIIVRSNGTVTYAGKDIAYQLWKLGQLGMDFYYKPFQRHENGQTVWVTTSNPADAQSNGDTPSFGGGQRVFNVIDSRQSYTQEVVRRGVAAVAPGVGEEASVHLSYEMVALSPQACEELGLELTEEDRARPFIEMSGRRGLGVKADDLLNRLEADAHREVESRNPDLSSDANWQTARTIATGALRYFLQKWTRNSLIAFDFKEALAFEGETGPYCQYAAVRANSIFRKLGEAAQTQATDLVVSETGISEIKSILEGQGGDDFWGLVLLAARLDEVISVSATTAEPANLAKYTFQLARSFNLFYHRHRILSEQDPVRRAVLITIANILRKQLTSALNTLGIQVPEKM